MALQLSPLPNFDVFMAGSKAPMLSTIGNAASDIMMSPYQGQKLRFDLDAAKLANELKRQEEQKNEIIMKYLPREKEAGLGLTSAQTSLANQQAKYYGPKSELEMQESRAKIEEAKEKTRKSRLLNDYLSGGGQLDQGQGQGQGQGQNPGQGQQQGNTEQPQQQIVSDQKGTRQEPSSSVYGIPNPSITKQDVINKALFGIDTYTPRAKAIQQQQQEQTKGMYARSIQASKEASDANEFGQLLDQYNYLMDQSLESGPVLGHSPSWATFGNAQSIDNIINKMGLGAIEQVRNAMNSARFAVADLNVALGLKPQRNWSKTTRQFYTDFTKGVQTRLNEKNKFNNVIANSPDMNVTNADADALWAAYQRHFPVSNSKGDQVQQENLNQWPLYVTKDAINSIKKTGDYVPKQKSASKVNKSHVTEENIQYTMKQTGLPRNEVIRRLKKKGLL